MTLYHKAYVICPHCANEEEVLIWDRIYVQEDPDLKERLLKKEIQSFDCLNCGEKTVMAEPLLYIDTEKNLIGYYCPEYKALLEQRPEQIESLPLPKAGEVSALEDGVAKAYSLRLTTSYNDLIEKIHAFDYEMDDRLLEVVKLALATRYLSEENLKIEEIYFLSANEEGLLFQILIESGWQTLDVPRDIYENARLALRDTIAGESTATWVLVDRAWALRAIGAV